ncbi:MAG: MCP four helix bundle domain-containing protein [Acidobacteriia bacterium]|nr:MCP four helix bundle domain-containing protein [Terriglobia bacterium]
MIIGKKISLTCAALSALSVAIGATSLIMLGQMQRNQEATVTDAMPGIYDIGRAQSLTKDMRGRMLMHIATSNEQERSQFESDISKYRDQFKGILKDEEKTITRAADREMFVKIEPAFDRFVASWEDVQALSRKEQDQAALALFQSSVLPAFQVLDKAVLDEVEQNKSFGDECAANSGRAARLANWWIWGLLIISITLGGAMGFFMVRAINGVLRQTATELTEGAGQIASASSQVASSSQSLAQGASEQAASLEETSASTEEITSMTRKNAENSKLAAEMMATVDQHVQEGNRTLEQMVGSMAEINSSSDKISKIIKVIDEIAFQTNILALNAAVEAARAGEAGMGFAVVADEVRTLAQRSAQAAKDTAAMIEESIAKSNEGSTKLQQVTEVIRAVTESAVKVKTLVDEVNLGSQEQARGIEQISKAVAQMDQVTQTTAANAEESASASEELSAQAEALNQIVRRLRALVDSSVSESMSTRPEAPASKPAARPGFAKRNLDALQSAVARRPAPAPVAVSAGRRDQDSFPLDDNFIEG